MTSDPRRSTSRRVQAADFYTTWLKQRAIELCEPNRIHRKLWEFCAIAQAYLDGDCDGGTALGFGVGKEGLPAWFANRGAYVTATDRPTPGVWDEAQHVDSAKQMRWKGICSESDFDERVHFLPVDMTKIPVDVSDIGYDFTWSSSCMEHLGSIEAGLAFFCKQMKCLRPGGIAAHTTEFNVLSNTRTMEHRDLVIFRQGDFEELRRRLENQGDKLWALDFRGGITSDDMYVDEAPYLQEPHLTLKLGDCTFTSIILIAQRGERRDARR